MIPLVLYINHTEEQQTFVANITIPLLKMRKLRLMEPKWITQCLEM